ncbi:hypothetical protein L1987_56937 [Smallanthus sonchifolius]|uniref:Uncharacterized protein n=1 Tax=Smallanthus sonchifolius TaxID=185202 RepID=A0ACB9DBL9_9ASTR|nr:hypothetical protein L1987_56937 [Smallanthus sonchifolius]
MLSRSDGNLSGNGGGGGGGTRQVSLGVSSDDGIGGEVSVESESLETGSGVAAASEKCIDVEEHHHGGRNVGCRSITWSTDGCHMSCVGFYQCDLAIPSSGCQMSWHAWSTDRW